MSNGDTPCPRCGKYFSTQGVLDHMRDYHHISRRDAGNLVAAAKAAAKPKPKPAPDDDDGAWIYRALDQQNKEHRAAMLAKADTRGWQELSPYHFRRWFGDTRVDWWPSGGKAQLHVRGSGRPPKMIYGQARVADVVARLIVTEHAERNDVAAGAGYAG